MNSARIANNWAAIHHSSEVGFFPSPPLGFYVLVDGEGPTPDIAGRAAAYAHAEVLKGAQSDMDQLSDEATVEPLDKSKTTKMLAGYLSRAAASLQARFEEQTVGVSLTAVFIAYRRAFVAHAGDVHLYLLRGEKVIKITEDQTLEDARRVGVISDEFYRKLTPVQRLHPFHLGMHSDHPVQMLAFPLQDGDHLIICTSIVGEALGPEHIAQTVVTDGVEHAPRKLIDQAIKAGVRPAALAVLRVEL
jgi:serine/threonine protein phosphatase PrpC